MILNLQISWKKFIDFTKPLFIFFFCISILDANPLQKAIDNAPSGATIKLSPSTYIGHITINKPLTILGTHDGVIIDGDGNSSVLTITSSNVTLKNLTIRNSGNKMYNLDSAIKIKSAKNIEINSCKILNSLYGIDMIMVEDSLISNNYISSKDNDIGLRGDALKVWYSHNNTFKENIIDKARDTTFTHSNNNIIINNNFINNRFALHIHQSDKNIVQNNNFKFNSVAVMIMDAQDTKILDNNILSSTGAAGIGVFVKEVSNFLLQNNRINYNAQGIYIDSKATEQKINRYIDNNIISYNKEAIHFHAIIKANSITNNKIYANIDDIVKSTKGLKTKINIIEYNYWSNYTGFDRDGDNIGDSTHKVYQYADQLWHYNHKIKFFYASPIMSLMNFLSQLAPFVEPILLLEDTKVVFKDYNQPL